MNEEWNNREGETPYEDIDGFKLIKKHPLVTRSIIEELEEYNVRDATLEYLVDVPSEKKAPFTYDWLLKLHKQMYQNVWDWAGQLRTQNTSIGTDKHHIAEELRMFVDDIAHMEEHFGPTESASRIHHVAVKIHPFKNGNGRWSRLLANIWLKQKGYPLTKWPNITDMSSIRGEYLKALRQADEFNYAPLIDLHERFTDSEG